MPDIEAILVNHADPTGEIANIIAGGSAANGAVVGAVRGALVSSGAGIGVSLAADLIGGTAGSALEQAVANGRVSLKESLVNGITNAASGAVTSGIRYLARDRGEGGSNLAGSVLGLAQGIGQMAMSPYTQNRDPRRGCGMNSPLSNQIGKPMAYGYRYDFGSLQRSGSVSRKRDEFSLTGLLKEAAIGCVMGGLAGTAFYGAGKVFGFLKDSVRDVRGDKGRSDVKVLYRGDKASVKPDMVFENGFTPKGTHNDVLLHTKGNTTAGNFISTTDEKGIAIDFAGKNGYIYVIKTDNYIDINTTYGANAYFPEQREFSIPGGIKPSEIVGAYKKKSGVIIGDLIHNPNFGGQ